MDIENEMDIEDDIDLINDIYLCNIHRVMPDRTNPLERYSSREIKTRYRFSPDIKQIILPLVDVQLQKVTERGCPIPTLIQLTIALRYYATGDLQRTCGELEYVTQSSVSKVVKRVSNALSEHVGTYIRFPSVNNMQQVKQDFYAIGGFPLVIGCIDGTYVDIKSPTREQGEIYRNRKGRFSINVQVIGGPNLQIYDIVARWPGSAHYSRIFHNSGIKQMLENNVLEGILLGDSGYPQLRYLYTPVPEPVKPVRPALNPLDPNYILDMFAYKERLKDYRAKSRYNRAHKSTRNTVERLFGNWKRRFLCIH